MDLEAEAVLLIVIHLQENVLSALTGEWFIS